MSTKTSYPIGYPISHRSKRRLTTGWRFHLGDLDGAENADFDDSGWESVNIPHTLKLTSLNLDDSDDDKTQPTFHRDVGWYRRNFTVDADPERKVFIEFEGAHQVTDAWVNGRHVGQHAIGGYTPFHFDVTDFVDRGGENVIALRVDNTKNEDIPPDPGPFDYIKFSGIYRELYLVQSDKLYIPFAWESKRSGVVITTPTVKGNAATIDVKTTVRNEHDESRTCTVKTRIIDADNRVVLTMTATAEIGVGSEYIFSQIDGLEDNVHLWSCDDPYLYRVNTTVFDGEEVVDCQENPLGLRWFELRDDIGFLLNGEPLMLVGVNRHQHFPFVGDAVPKSLHRKDAIQFKEAGFNVVRLAHYPHDNAFIEACDELGMLVYEEAPTWIDFGGEAWTHNLEKAQRRAIRNHRNHPSIFAWGGGINHRGAFEPLHYSAKEEDPTRWTGSNHAPWTGAQCSGICDFYSNMDYRNLPEPVEPMFAVEHGISVDGERAQIMVSRYKASPRRFGMAAWTAHAYYTFHHQTGGQRNRTRGGMMDIFRIPRPVYYWYQTEMTDEPLVYIADLWREGVESIRVFSNCDEVELLVNGVSLGRRKPDADPLKAHLKSPPFTFPVVWATGEIEAKGRQGDKVVATAIDRTPESPERIELTVDLAQRTLAADGADMVLAFARVVDGNGTIVTDFDERVRFDVQGPAVVVGGPEIGSNPMECFDGIAPVLVRAGLEPGEIRLTASVDGLSADSVTFASIANEEDVIAAMARPIYDLPRAKIDIGGVGQHVQYGWMGWNGEDGIESTFSLPSMAGVTATLQAADGDTLRWRDESNVPGPLGFVAEDGVCAEGKLTLTFDGLEPGSYQLTSYHHGPESDTDNMDPLGDKVYVADIRNMRPAALIDAVLIDAVLIDAVVGKNHVEQPDGAEVEHYRAHVQSSGNRVEADGPGAIIATFTAGDDGQVVIRYEGNGPGSVWLNGFVLEKQV